MYKDTGNVEHEMYDYTGNNRSHWSNNKGFKEKSGSHNQEVVAVAVEVVVVSTSEGFLEGP